MRIVTTLVSTTGFVLLGSCAERQTVTLPDIDISTSSDGIVALPADVPEVFREHFVKYTNVRAPNGKPIHILAQDGWTVPAYTLPKNLENVEVFRMVVKENLSMDMVCRFLESVATAVEEFEELESGGRTPQVHRGPKLLC